MAPARHASGFSLIEAVIGASLVAAVVMGLAHVVTVSNAQSARARRALVALSLAQSKLEYLRSLAWDFDAAGVRVSSNELALSPGDSLRQDSPPYVEVLDDFGAVAPDGAAGSYVRRWAVGLADADDPETLLLSVCVFSMSQVRAGLADACVWTARARRP